MQILQKVALIFTIIGAINWGLVGLLNIDLVAYLFGSQTMFARIVYTLVAICGLANIGILINHIEFGKD